MGRYAVPRDRALALFDALGSADKTLHANPGNHGTGNSVSDGQAATRRS